MKTVYNIYIPFQPNSIAACSVGPAIAIRLEVGCQCQLWEKCEASELLRAAHADPG